MGFGNPSGDENAPFNPIAFLWTQNGGMKNLGTLARDKNSIAYAINIHGLIVRQSFGGPNGSLTLVYANDVNNYGVIVGGAFNAKTGESPAFVAIPY